MGKKGYTSNPNLSPLAIAPRTPVALRHWRDGVEYWVSGYAIVDIEGWQSCKGGTLKLKRTQIGKIYLTDAAQVRRPTQYALEDVQAIEPGRVYHTFDQVFGRAGVGAIVIDADFEEAEDLTLGVGDVIEMAESGDEE